MSALAVSLAVTSPLNLAEHPMEIGILIGAIFLFVLARSWLEQRKRQENERLRILEQALQGGKVDREAMEVLAQHLGSSRRVVRVGGGLAVLLAIGWLTLFTGIGLIALAVMLKDPDVRATGTLVGIIGFGLVTYPFALRELEARRLPQ